MRRADLCGAPGEKADSAVGSGENAGNGAGATACVRRHYICARLIEEACWLSKQTDLAPSGNACAIIVRYLRREAMHLQRRHRLPIAAKMASAAKSSRRLDLNNAVSRSPITAAARRAASSSCREAVKAAFKRRHLVNGARPSMISSHASASSQATARRSLSGAGMKPYGGAEAGLKMLRRNQLGGAVKLGKSSARSLS